MIRSLLVCAVLAASPALAQPTQQAAPPPAAVFDSNGWTLLGTQTVKGQNDRDTFPVGRYEGRFDQVTMVVTDGDVAIKDLAFVFANGERWSPQLKTVFKEGSRTRAIDLPGDNRTIQKIEVVYASPPGTRARVFFYGRDKKANNRPTGFDSRGWQLLGSQSVDGRRDRDTLMVGRYEGKFDQITMVVSDSDLEMRDLTVVFGNGERWSPRLKHTFREGQRSRVIDLPGDNRTIAKIELAYANLPGGGKARVDVYGRDKKKPLPTTPPPTTFDPTGWTQLGIGVVNGARDRDAIRVGRAKGGFDQITMVVNDGDLDLADLTIVFTGGLRWSPRIKHTFREGQRSRVIDLPGKDRTITRIELAYAKIPGGGKPRVEIWARDVGRPAPPPIQPITWEKTGWTFLGKRTVDGWRDRDKLMVTAGRPFSELMFVVVGSDVQVNNVLVTFGNGEKLDLPANVTFKENTRTAPLDLPGKLRKIRSVEFAYANLPGGGRATIEVWARAKMVATPVAPPPPAQTPPPPPPPGPDVRDHRTK